MWVEVMQWSADGEIDGLLQNDPFHIKALRAGAKVRVKERDIFDYLLYRADGTTDGNETGELIQKQAGPERRK